MREVREGRRNEERLEGQERIRERIKYERGIAELLRTGHNRSSNVNDIETKGQTFRYRSLLSERKQNVLVWSASFRNESKTY
jgi:hypothetical protein